MARVVRVVAVGLLTVGIGVARADPKYAGSCASSGCHGPLLEHKFLHAPVEAGCDACHQTVDETKHTFRLISSGAALCRECHDRFEGVRIHAPLADDGDCMICHNPHGGKTRALLVADSVGEQCAACHEEVIEGVAFLHGPVAAGDCTTCHHPHVSQYPALTRVEGARLCIECHEDMGRKLSDLAHAHEPAKDACLTCHRPHGGANRLLLSSAPPTLCAECHGEVMSAATDATHSHSPVLEGAGCTTCHDAHASASGGLLIQPQADLCLSCHERSIEHKGRRIAGLGGRIGGGAHVHPPVQDGGCSLCHAVHGNERKALLTAAFPERFYVGFAEDRYALCLECHDAEAFTESETQQATAFRNGSRNLHALHVNQAAKGRTCGACHDPHGSTQHRLMAERVPFGAWEIPIRFTSTETGGTCATGCHRPYGYDRVQAVVNVSSEP